MTTSCRAPLALAALALLAPATQAADAPGSAALVEPLVTVQPVPGATVEPVAAPVAEDDTALAPPELEEAASTAIYVYPTSPSTFVPVVGLPSFVIQPGAPVPEVATHVVHSVPLPAWPAGRALGDLDCSNFEGTVRVVRPDVNFLDPDGDGIGCEPHER
ncbi:MAG TPA: hypothetical protein VGN80_02385 [Devosiaceae bacterium]|nr:hypothetical protein [Devosiaceae bacterium]